MISPKMASDGTEEWRVVASCPKYKVSNKGNVIGPSGKVLKPNRMQIGYNSIVMSTGYRSVTRKYIHILVAEAFIGEIPAGYVVNHKDQNKRNNNLENLEIVTRKQNARSWVNSGGSHSPPGSSLKRFCEVHNTPYSLFPGGKSYCSVCRSEKEHLHKIKARLIPPYDTIWKVKVVGSGSYLVAADGRVWSCKSQKLLSPGTNTVGYKYVNLKGKNFSISRLVAELFIREINADEVVDHIDGDKLNNKLENLRIVSRSENTKSFHAQKRLNGDPVNTLQKLTDQQAQEIINIRSKKGMSARAIGALYGVPKSTIDNIIYGINFKHLSRPEQAVNTEKFRKKLCDDDAIKIINLFAQGCRVSLLAAEFGVSPASVRDLVCGKTYKHLPRP